MEQTAVAAANREFVRQFYGQLAAGNIIGCTLLGAVFWRTHPELPNEFRTAMSGTGTWSTH